MLRKTISGAGATALLTTALLVGFPTAEAAPTYHPWGTTNAKDQVLQRGCHVYTYRYSITAPTDRWAAEIFIVNPNGRTLASNTLDTASDPDRGSARVTLCRPSTVLGVHKIKMKITWQRGREIYDGFVKPSTFRLTRR